MQKTRIYIKGECGHIDVSEPINEVLMRYADYTTKYLFVNENRVGIVKSEIRGIMSIEEEAEA